MNENVQFSKNFSNLPRVLHPLLQDSSSKPRSPIQVGDHVKVRHLGGVAGPHKHRLVMIDFYPYAMKSYKWFYNHDLQLYIYDQNCQHDGVKRCKQQTCQNDRTRELLETDRCPRFETPSSRSRENFLRRSGKTSKGNPTKSRGASQGFCDQSFFFVFWWVLVSCWCFEIFGVSLSVCMISRRGNRQNASPSLIQHQC